MNSQTVDCIEAFSDFVHRIYQGSTTRPIDEFKPWALAELAILVPHDSAMWGQALHGEVVPFNIHLHRQPPEMLSSWQTLQHLDPLANALLSAPSGTTVDFNDLLPRQEFLQHPLYLDHARHFGKEYTLSTGHHDDAFGLNTFVSIYRADPDLPFSPAERWLKQVAFQHLVEAQRQNVLHHLRVKPDGEGDDLFAHGVVDPHRQLHLADKELVDRLRKEWPDWHGPLLPDGLGLATAGQQMSQERIGKVMAWTIQPLGQLYHLSVRKLDETDALPTRMRSVANLLARGLTYKEVARQLHISPSTVTNQANKLYQRLGVKNKAELAQRLSRPPSVTLSS